MHGLRQLPWAWRQVVFRPGGARRSGECQK
jgi:hypothetical protein